MDSRFNLICGGGGSRAVLGSSGMLLACEIAGIKSWRTAGGVSGGSIPSLMAAAGVPPARILHEVIQTDFSSMLTPKTNMLGLWWAFFLKECAWKRRSTKAVLGSDKIGLFVEQFVTVWPEGYWTLAVTGDTTLLFTSKGVFELHPDGRQTQICDKPAPVGLAIRASCAVPGIIEAIPFNGEYLLDGGLADRCPVGVAKKVMGAEKGTIVACDVGEDSIEAERREHIFFRTLRKLVCGPCCDPEPFQPADNDGVVLVRPPLDGVEALEFTYTADEKWQAVMSGFKDAVSEMRKAGVLTGDRLEQALGILTSFETIRSSQRKLGDLASQTADLLAKHGLY
jgi:predicted acylesterase/phospholipase RssA